MKYLDDGVIQEYFESLTEDDEVRCIVFLNCGGSLALAPLLEACRIASDLSCFVLDSHRPFHQRNLANNIDRVIILDDDPIAHPAVLRGCSVRPPGTAPGLEQEDWIPRKNQPAAILISQRRL